MNRKLFKALALIAALIVCLAVATAGVAAGTSVTIPVHLIMDNSDSVQIPTIAITLTVEPVTGSTPTGSFPISTGITTGITATNLDNWSATATSASGTVAFSSSSSTTEGASGNAGGSDAKKFATVEATLNFGSVSFPEVGVYRYKITESSASLPLGVALDGIPTRYLDIYVTRANEGAGELQIESFVMLTEAVDVPWGEGAGEGAGIGTGGTYGTKNGEFKNVLTSYDLTLSKTVSGNQGSRTEYFKFTVTITNPTTGTYTVDKTNGAGNGTTGNPQTITAGAPTDFYLKHGESIVIKDLPAGATYTISEEKKNYEASYKIGENGTPVTSNATGAQTLNADTDVTFTNTLNGTIPTGVLLTIAPFAVLMLVGLLGVLVFMRKKRAE